MEVHYADWWIYKFESYGFRYSPELTDLARGLAKSHKTDEMPNGQNYKAQHIWLHIMVRRVIGYWLQLTATSKRRVVYVSHTVSCEGLYKSFGCVAP